VSRLGLGSETSVERIYYRAKYAGCSLMKKRKFGRPKTEKTAYCRIRQIILRHIEHIWSEAEKRVGQRVGDAFFQAAVAVALALIPSSVTQGMSIVVLTTMVTRILKSVKP